MSFVRQTHPPTHPPTTHPKCACMKPNNLTTTQSHKKNTPQPTHPPTLPVSRSGRPSHSLVM